MISHSSDSDREKQTNNEAQTSGVSKPAKDSNLITFQPGDAEDPQQWSTARKRFILLVTCMGSAIVTCCSSVISIASEPIQKQFHVSEEVATLSVSFFVLGLAIGPVLLGPLSEFYGRRVSQDDGGANISRQLRILFFAAIPVAFANHIALLLVFRFLCGAAGGAFLANVGGTIADIYTPFEAYIPMANFAAMFIGPVLGPNLGGFVVSFSSRWRWMLYAIIIWSFFELVLLGFAAPETLPAFLFASRLEIHSL